jgi:signal transduction histidine kinase
VRWFRLVARPVDVAALPGWLLVTHLDISARVLADASLRAADRRSLSGPGTHLDLLDGLGDEMRTPLNAIIGLSELMAEEQLGPLGSDLYRHYAGDVLAAGRRLRHLVDTLGEFNDIRGGRVILEDGVIDLSATLTALADQVAARAAAAQLTVGVEVEPLCPCLRADSLRFRQMVGALLDNALRYTPPGGAITLLAGPGDADDLLVTVADTGPGIPAHDRLRVLEPFSRGGTGREDAEGLGLGLPLAQALAELHGGRLMLKVRRGGGVAAVLRFPPERVVAV